MSDELPQGWAAVPVAEAIEDFQPGFASGEKNVEGGVAHLRMNNIGLNGELVLDLIRTVPETLAKPQHNLHPGDVIVCTTNSAKLVGKCAYFDLKGRYAFSNHLTRLRPKPGLIDGKFLRWNLWFHWKRGVFDDKCKHWVNQSSIPKDALLEDEVALPPLAEQRRIVAKLEKLLGQVDACQQRLAKIPTLLKRFRQSVLAAACSGRLTADWREEHDVEDVNVFIERMRAKRPARYQDASVRDDLELTEIPDTWSWTNLRFLLSTAEAFCYGVVQPGADEPGGALLVRAGDLDAGRVDTSGLRRIPLIIHDEYRRSQLAGGEILVTVVGAGIGETAIAQRECAGFNIARAVAKLPVREFEARYVHLWLQTSRAIGWMKGDSREVARPTLNLEQLQTLPVPIAPLPEQQEIVRRVEGLFALADQIETRLAAAQRQVDALTPSLLARAFAGKLVPQDPTDEPASALLERMRSRVPDQKGRSK